LHYISNYWLLFKKIYLCYWKLRFSKLRVVIEKKSFSPSEMWSIIYFFPELTIWNMVTSSAWTSLETSTSKTMHTSSVRNLIFDLWASLTKIREKSLILKLLLSILLWNNNLKNSESTFGFVFRPQPLGDL
jgi:hypothetical protein